MDAATAHFRADGWTEIDNTSAYKPYDLVCRRRGVVLFVEVKGTRNGGGAVFVTANEVDHAAEHRGRCALFVLSDIQVSESNAAPQLSGGSKRILYPWNPREGGTLRPITYRYGLPSEHY